MIQNSTKIVCLNFKQSAKKWNVIKTFKTAFIHSSSSAFTQVEYICTVHTITGSSNIL